MPKDNYPLHPGQTHAEPYYVTIPVEEYESLKDEINHLRGINETMRAELERRGVIVISTTKNTKCQEVKND
jgi:PHD/YefM family antitoxin component YafN of YafNO toxin-antitoxin module